LTIQPEIGTIFEQPGFRGEVIGFLSGLMVIEGRLEGTLTAHASERDEFAIVIEGEIIVTVAGTRSELKAGQSIIVSAGMRHEVEAIRPARLLLIG
jgi:mannose-6-phosphate isomerase-like protein (cupin superfamily)